MHPGKRIFDLFLLVTAHLGLLPIWVLLWISIPVAIKLEDRGPIFYGQQRAGRHGRSFMLLKFRTMVPGADRQGAWTVNNDIRVTRIGKLLRRTALDELPGLVSIWKGDMSFVGPRALATSEHKFLEERIPGFEHRLKVPPGLTGLAQVYNPSDDPVAKLRHDLDYIHRCGVLLDIKLIILSVRNTLLGRWDNRAGKAEHKH